MSKMGVNKVNCFDAFDMTDMTEIISMLASYEYLDVEAALNQSIKENNQDLDYNETMTKQLETLSKFKPDPNAILMSRDELKKRIETFIKTHSILFSVAFLEDLKVKAEIL